MRYKKELTIQLLFLLIDLRLTIGLNGMPKKIWDWVLV